MSTLRPALWTRTDSQVTWKPDSPAKTPSRNGEAPTRRPRPPRKEARPSQHSPRVIDTRSDPLSFRGRQEARPSQHSQRVIDTRSDPLSFRGRQYTHLSPAECSTVRDVLQQQKHPRPRLKAAGFSLPVGKRFKDSPAAVHAAPGRTAIVLGCEMGVPEGKLKLSRELLHVTAIDFFSGEVLVDSLATPAQKIMDYRTEVHGITAAGLKEAARVGRALPGFGAARAELFEHIDANTVVVGHDLADPFRVLRLRHPAVLDTSILVSDAAVGFAPTQSKLHGLPRLAKELLGLDMRAAPDQPHSTLEEVLITRELALWCLRNPTGLGVWATDAQRKFFLGL